MTNPIPTNTLDPVMLTFQLGLAVDSATGDVFLAMGDGVVPLGNTRTRQIYLQRVYRTQAGDTGPIIPTSHHVGWTMDEDVDMPPEQLAFQSMMLNFGWQPSLAADTEVSLDNYLNASAEEIVPRIVGGKLNGLEIMRRAASVAVRWRQGLAAPMELSEALDLITTWVSLLPQQMLAAVATMGEPEPEKSKLVLPAGVR